MSDGADQSAADIVGQKLQSADEVYIYKIPPLATAGGHRYVQNPKDPVWFFPFFSLQKMLALSERKTGI